MSPRPPPGRRLAFGSLPIPLRRSNHGVLSKHIIYPGRGVKGVWVSNVR